MQSGHNTALTTSIDGLVSKAGAKIADAIGYASKTTGVDFSYLLQQAHVESSFNPDVKAKTSSATGLYQFLDKTWLDMVNKYGDKFGLEEEAAKISDNGKVSSKTDKADILALRNDPKICSLMAAQLACENKEILESKTAGDVGATDLYLAHFMGPAAAAKFINAMDANPNAKAAALFPAAASANKGVFYDKSGKAKSLEAVYATFEKKFTACETETVASTTTSTATPAPTETAPTTALASAHKINAAHHTTTGLGHNWSNLYKTSETTGTQQGSLTTLGSLISPLDVLAIMKHAQSDRYNS
ncbi:MAG: transglycosylase SLT domain-containing protein [Pseudobdellovibrionaceae bacterium]